jgi:hypothetical protein
MELRALADGEYPGCIHLCEPRSLSVDVLSMSSSALHRGLPSQNGFLFLLEPLNLLLDSG